MTEKNIAIVPAYNESNHIRSVIEDILEVDIVSDIVVVDDNSADNTVEIVEQMNAHLVENDQNRGMGGAVKRGYEVALELGADTVFRLDGDGQHNPSDLTRFYHRLKRTDCDYVLGNRFADPTYREAMPQVRIAGNRIVALLTSLRIQQIVHDPTSGYRAMDPNYLERIPYEEYSNDFEFGVEELIAFKYIDGRICEVEIDCIYGEEESSLTYYNGFKYLYPLVSWWNHRKTYS